MATKIIHKKSSVASSVPAAGDLEPGELAINLADQKLYSKTTGGTVIPLGGITEAEADAKYLLDSELTSEASVKALNQGVATTDSPSFVNVTATTSIAAGVSDTSYGLVNLYGNGTGSSQGGQINIFNPADHDTTNEGYTIKAWADQWRFTKIDGTDLFQYVNSDGSFRFPSGTLWVGTNDNTKGLLYLLGNGAGSTAGGEIRLYSAADYDTNINYYSVYTEAEDFLISFGSTDFLQYDYSASQWLMPRSGGLDVTGPVSFGNAIQETVYTISGTTPALDPANGTVQTWTLTAASTPTDSLSAGESITLMIDDGTAYTITWPTMTWVNNGGTAPTLATTGYTVIALWKVSTTLYGALVGDGS